MFYTYTCPVRSSHFQHNYRNLLRPLGLFDWLLLQEASAKLPLPHSSFAGTYSQSEVEIVVCRRLRLQIWNGDVNAQKGIQNFQQHKTRT
jgi:hypothetical protein